MIAHVTGKLVHKEPSRVILEAGGVGYEIRISLQTFSSLGAEGENVKLLTYLQVREDAHTLYGFSDVLEKEIFEHLISVSGIGAVTAMMILSSLSADELFEAIASENVARIQSVKGVGQKTAERLVVELKDKFRSESFRKDKGELVNSAKGNLRTEAIRALVSLGINRAQAEKSIAKTLAHTDGKDNLTTLEEVIKIALKYSQ